MTYKRKEIIGDCALYLGDCLEVMPTLGKVDAVVTDPPYGMNLNAAYSNSEGNKSKVIKKSKGYKNVIGDNKPFDPSPFLGICSEQFWWGGDYYIDKLPKGGSWMVWDKRHGLGDFDYSLSEFEMLWCKKKRHRKIIRFGWFGACGTESQDIRERVHPTQKPVQVMTPIIKLCGQTILDPFMGSGTTGVACVKLGRKFIGIELDEGYFDIACKRIEESYKQPDLFIEPKIKYIQDKII